MHSVFGNVDKVVSSTLDIIVHQINMQAKKLVGTSHVVQLVEDVNRMDGIAILEKKQIKW